MLTQIPFEHDRQRPRLLVSIRSEAEATAAIHGGANILDVKDPERGSLGCPEPSVLNSICNVTVLNSAGRLPCLSTALGEYGDWVDQSPFRLPDRVSMAKLGLSGAGRDPHWIDEWVSVRRRFEDQRGSSLTWVAVAYVDEADAQSPPVFDVADAAIETGCAGLLLDTWSKSHGRLFDYVTEQRIADLADRLHATGGFLAAAGRLNLEDIARLADWPVDVVAVRSAACEKSDRRSAVTSSRVVACRAALGRAERRLSDAC